MHMNLYLEHLHMHKGRCLYDICAYAQVCMSMHVCMHMYVNIVYTCVDAYVSICTCTHVFANVVSVYACMAA